jgi:hypothetical protein
VSGVTLDSKMASPRKIIRERTLRWGRPMSYDSDEGYFHLTSNGWVRKDEEPFPPDRIETWEYSSSQASGWSREYQSVHCVWANADVSRSDRDALRKKFGNAAHLTASRDNTIGEPI